MLHEILGSHFTDTATAAATAAATTTATTAVLADEVTRKRSTYTCRGCRLEIFFCVFSSAGGADAGEQVGDAGAP